LNGEIDGMSEMILTLIEHAALQQDNLPADSWDHCWQPYARERMQKSRALQAFYKENHLWYAVGFRDQIGAILTGAAPPTRRRWLSWSHPSLPA
jgi:hypothetical protein